MNTDTNMTQQQKDMISPYMFLVSAFCSELPSIYSCSLLLYMSKYTSTSKKHPSFPFFLTGARKTAQRKTADRAEKKRAREREPTYDRDKECIASHQIHRSLAYDKKAAERKWRSLTFHLTFCLHFFISSWTGVRPGDWGGGDRGKIHLNWFYFAFH